MRTHLCALLAAVLLLGAACCTQAQEFRIIQSSLNSGGGAMSNEVFRINGSIGQTAAGTAKNSILFAWIGFWGGDAPDPRVVSNIAEAKMLPDDTYVSIVGKIATTSASEFTDRFWIQDSNRASGLLVKAPTAELPALAHGSIVNAIGTLDTDSSGARCLTGPIVFIMGSTAEPKPLGMANKFIGGGNLGSPTLAQRGVTGGVGINNVGLLVKTWGKVIPGDAGYVTIDDGSGTPVRIPGTKLASPPSVGTSITVIGMSGLYYSGGGYYRLVIPRDGSEVVY